MRRQFFGGVLGQGAGLASTLIIQFLQVPLLLHISGTIGYGQFLVTIAVPSLLSLSDFGLLAAVSTAMLHKVSVGDVRGARRICEFGTGVLLLISSAILLLVIAGAFMLPYIASELPYWAPIVFGLYGVYALVGLQMNAEEGILRADRQQALGWSALALTRLVEFALGAVLGLTFSSVVGYVAGLLIGRAIGATVLHIVRTRRVVWASRVPRFGNWREHAQLVRPMVGSIAQPAATYVFQQGTTLIVGAALGPAVVAQLGVLRTLVTLIRQSAQVFIGASVPLITQSWARRDFVALRRTYRTTILTSIAVVLAGGSALVAFGPMFVRLWTDGRIEAGRGLVAAFVVLSACEVAVALASAGLVARNRHFAFGLGRLALAGLYCGAVLVFVPSGLAGVVLSQAVAVLFAAGLGFGLQVRENRRDLRAPTSRREGEG